MKIHYNFEEIEEFLYPPVKPELNIKKRFWNGAVVLTEKNLQEFIKYTETLESDLNELRNFIKIQKKLQNLRTKEEFDFDNYIKIQSEEGYDEEFERVKSEFEEAILRENNENEERE